MLEQYVAPELTLAGDANEIVLGSLGPGVDLDSQLLVQEMEFEGD